MWAAFSCTDIKLSRSELTDIKSSVALTHRGEPLTGYFLLSSFTVAAASALSFYLLKRGLCGPRQSLPVCGGCGVLSVHRKHYMILTEVQN